MPGRLTQQRETRLLAEYLAEKVYPHRYAQNVPLGKPEAEFVAKLGFEKGLAASRPFRLKVDAVAWYPDRLDLIEAKIFKLLDGVAKLPVYKSLVPLTPELAAWKSLPVRMVLVAPWTSEALHAYTASQGIEVVIYKPAWIAGYVQDMNDYWTAAATGARNERLRLQESLGLRPGR